MASLPRSVRLVRALVVVTCLVPLVQACGGRSDTEDYLFGSDGTITTGASSSMAGRASTGGTRAANGGASATAGRNGTAGTSPSIGGGATTGGGGPIQGGGTTIGGTRPVGGTPAIGGMNTVGGASTAGTGGAVAVTPIVCGAQVCDAATQSCCAGLSGLSCIGNGQACDGAVLGCTVNADCAGKGVCCISITGDVSAASSCKERCDTGTSRDRQLCQTDEECVPPTRYCTPTIFGVNICTRRP